MLTVYFADAKGFEKCPAMRDHIETRDLKGKFLVDYNGIKHCFFDYGIPKKFKLYVATYSPLASYNAV